MKTTDDMLAEARAQGQRETYEQMEKMLESLRQSLFGTEHERDAAQAHAVELGSRINDLEEALVAAERRLEECETSDKLAVEANLIGAVAMDEAAGLRTRLAALEDFHFHAAMLVGVAEAKEGRDATLEAVRQIRVERDDLRRRLTKADAQNTAHRSAWVRLGRHLIESGYRGDGVLDGVEWLRTRLADAGRRVEEATRVASDVHADYRERLAASERMRADAERQWDEARAERDTLRDCGCQEESGPCGECVVCLAAKVHEDGEAIAGYERQLAEARADVANLRSSYAKMEDAWRDAVKDAEHYKRRCAEYREGAVATSRAHDEAFRAQGEEFDTRLAASERQCQRLREAGRKVVVDHVYGDTDKTGSDVFCCEECDFIWPRDGAPVHSKVCFIGRLHAALADQPATPGGRDEVLTRVREEARRLGYAIAVHGSLARDIDLVAVPWVAEAVDTEVLACALRDVVGGAFGSTLAGEVQREGEKPHGRRAWIIGTPQLAQPIDLSVMPRKRDYSGFEAARNAALGWDSSPRDTHLIWNGTEWVDDRCGCRYHPDDDNGSHGGAPHVHPCEQHSDTKARAREEMMSMDIETKRHVRGMWDASVKWHRLVTLMVDADIAEPSDAAEAFALLGARPASPERLDWLERKREHFDGHTTPWWGATLGELKLKVLVEREWVWRWSVEAPGEEVMAEGTLHIDEECRDDAWDYQGVDFAKERCEVVVRALWADMHATAERVRSVFRNALAKHDAKESP